jgi:hypothetical protein
MSQIPPTCDWRPRDPATTIYASPKGISPGMKQHERGAAMQESGASTRTQIKLLRGQTHYAQLRRGTVIGVAHGTVSISSRVHLEHATLALQTPVHQGGVYCVHASGWFEIAAQGEVALWLVLPESLFQMATIASWVGRFFGRFSVKSGLPSWHMTRRRG